jgi:hypothetical protein
MKPRVLAILALVITLGNSCKKSSDNKDPYNLAKTEWQGEARLIELDYKPVKVLFKENHELEISFIPVVPPHNTYTFYGTWAKADDSDEVEFIFTKGVETVTCNATLTENNTKMDNGKFKSSVDEDLDAGSFKLTRQ